MYAKVSQQQKHAAEDAQAHHILPERKVIESEGGKDCGAGDFDVEAVFVVHEAEVAGFVYDESFKPVVEDGELRNTKSVEGVSCEGEREGGTY